MIPSAMFSHAEIFESFVETGCSDTTTSYYVNNFSRNAAITDYRELRYNFPSPIYREIIEGRHNPNPKCVVCQEFNKQNEK